MFAAWGRLVYRRRVQVLVGSAVFLALSLVVLLRGGTLSTGMIEGIEAERALRWIEDGLRQPGGSSFTVIFSSREWRASDPRFRAAMRAALAPLRGDPRVLSVETPADVPGPLAEQWVSADGHRALAFVNLRAPFRVAGRQYPAVRELVRPGPLDTTFTGFLAFKHDLDVTLERDLVRAELVSIPLALLVLLVVFATAVAATLPAGVGLLAVVGSLAVVVLLSLVMDMAQYAINVVTLIGLAVAIDYSLFIVSRYREELARGAAYPAALERAVATAGRAVAFSGLAVGIGLCGLLFFPHSYLFAIGIAGCVVVFLSVACALTFLPALLAVLGSRIHAGRFPISRVVREGFWRRVAAAVMDRPLLALVPSLALVLTVAVPFLDLRITSADVRILPPGAEARRGDELIRRELPEAAANRIAAVVRFPGDTALTPERISALYDLSRRMAALPGVRRVESIVDLDPRIDREGYQRLLAVPALLLPGDLRFALRKTVGGPVAVLAAVTDNPHDGAEARAVVRALRADRRVGDGTLLVTGATANDLDATAFLLDHAPAAIGFVVLATYVVLFLLLGSLLLPLEAVLMNVLSIAGSFGVLVWIFQQGHLASWLRFEPGPIELNLPLILFCVLFGLSMDYEVFLLSRIQEEYLRLGDNRRAVAEGLERSGRLITSAAAIMVAVFAAFSLAHVVLIKALGLGMALAVAIDATLVRIVIVPATMRLFGDLNWWAPRPVARWFGRNGRLGRRR